MSVVVWDVRGLGSLGPCLGCLACVDPNGWGTMLASGGVIIAMEEAMGRVIFFGGEGGSCCCVAGTLPGDLCALEGS